jgi:hypothetical protein
MGILDKYKEILSKDLFLNLLKGEIDNCPMQLTGGAINDILAGRNPKDYDFEYNSDFEKKMKESDKFKLLYTSKSAITYEYHSNVIQLLHKERKDFPYTIEQGRFNVRNGDLQDFDHQSFENKILIPNSRAYEEMKIARHVIRRLLKWQDKGYKIDHRSYGSVLKIAFKSTKAGGSEIDDEDEES